jgi:hypothetical protein
VPGRLVPQRLVADRQARGGAEMGVLPA